MKVIILAGGKGLRLKEVVKDIPKPMAKVGKKPFLEYLILQLIDYGFKDVILSVGYKKEVIESYFGNGNKFGINIKYFEERSPLGTGGAIIKAMQTVEEQDFIVMNGDSFLDLDINYLFEQHENKSAIATIALRKVDNVERYGEVKIDNNSQVISFNEKSSKGAGLMNTGVYILNRKIIEGLAVKRISLEKDIFPRFISRGIYGIESKGFFIDIGIPKDYLNLCSNPESLYSRMVVK